MIITIILIHQGLDVLITLYMVQAIMIRITPICIGTTTIHITGGQVFI